MKKILATVLAFSPALALAANTNPIGSVGNLGQLMDASLRVINSYLIPLLIAVAVLVFFWGIIKYIGSQGNDDSRKEARHLMVWGIIALFVMVSVWGLVGLLSTTLGGTNQPPPTPYVPIGTSQ